MEGVSAVVEVHDPERGEDKLNVVKAEVQAHILPIGEQLCREGINTPFNPDQ